MKTTMYSVSAHNPMSGQTEFLWDGNRLNEKEISKALIIYLKQIEPTETLMITISKTLSEKGTQVYENYEIRCDYYTEDGRFYNWCGDTSFFDETPHNITKHLNECLVITEEHLEEVVEDSKPCRVITQQGELKVFQILPKESCILTECGDQYRLMSCPIRDMTLTNFDLDLSA